jgi:hypothetical protein
MKTGPENGANIHAVPNVYMRSMRGAQRIRQAFKFVQEHSCTGLFYPAYHKAAIGDVNNTPYPLRRLALPGMFMYNKGETNGYVAVIKIEQV